MNGFSSLGGTSLINANVALEADDRVWQMSVWPDEIRNDCDSIKRGITILLLAAPHTLLIYPSFFRL